MTILLERMLRFALAHHVHAAIVGDCLLVGSPAQVDVDGQWYLCSAVDYVSTFSELRAVLGY